MKIRQLLDDYYLEAFVGATLLLPMVLICLILAGCDSKPAEKEAPGLMTSPSQDDEGFLLILALDLSGSFRDQFAKDGRAFRFATDVCDQFFRSRSGTDDEIIVCQLAASNKPMVWQGSAERLREDLEDPEAFRQMLLKKSDPNGSRIHDGLADVLEYAWTQPGVASGKRKVMLVCCSDMEDTTEPRSEARLVNTLKSFARVKPAIGLYWVDQRYYQLWRKHLIEAGLKNFAVEADPKAQATLPRFEN